MSFKCCFSTPATTTFSASSLCVPTTICVEKLPLRFLLNLFLLPRVPNNDARSSFILLKLWRAGSQSLSWCLGISSGQAASREGKWTVDVSGLDPSSDCSQSFSARYKMVELQPRSTRQRRSILTSGAMCLHVHTLTAWVSSGCSGFPDASQRRAGMSVNRPSVSV